MCATQIKPDYRIPGLKYKRSPGLLTGRLYTTFPMRFSTAITHALVASIFAFLVLWVLLAVGGDATSLIDAIFLAILILILGYPVFVIHDPGERIKITKNELIVGRCSYDVKHVSSFYKITYYNSKKRVHGHCVGFRNGEREEEILVFNKAEVIEGIIPFLNRAREAIQAEQVRVAHQSGKLPDINAPRPMEF